ncbi:MAG: hypothetical protein P1V81_02835 [Planctomycetota bacterium]|nr:hypothetical protein [Planctomycetota bacterium]
MTASLAALCLLPLLAPTPIGTAPPELRAQDLTFGTSAPSVTPPSSYLGLVPGHSLRFEVSADPTAGGGLAVLGVSSALASSPVPLGSGLLLIDPAGLQVLGVGLLDGAGQAAFDLSVPLGLPVGVQLATQAAVVDPQLGLHLTQAIEHTLTDLQLQVLENFKKSIHPSAGSQAALLITDQTSWLAFYARHKSAAATPPAVDFGKQVVVVGFGGHFITFGYSVQIDAVVPLVGGGLEVHQTVLTPGFGCGSLPSESKPGQIVAVDRVVGGAPVVAVTQSMPAPPCP